ncbi:glyoxylase-like metal-dependent hydrolase (beta-lactamase superfamily II) [Mucilaginibacter yixingensis]|uniref:Glyoxylase-like metal-dependent hydrolase (Beta-lactamase superfamily II) n=2 Tax=Mucilaginibacter yixingensis TaxID=1295612 RepID=A0A2T5J913_9SPHI|nr:glyoxylase-like metal-dependent hydrolase (beta-lactamase superfamily II) [Mucilaginibacter yixingensis]
MIIEQIYTGCLAQGAYYIQSGNEAAIVDPLREVEPYIRKAKAAGAIIKYVFETHFHADFVSGHLDLAKKTGATIVYGPTAQPAFKAHVAKNNEIFKLGEISIQLLHTPGHTLESVCLLVLDEQGRQTGLFSGDTLFIGDVGRPDLAQKAAHMTQEELAGMLYNSLRNSIMPLNDDVIVYPAHGAGSACGKNMSKETTDTLGNQKKYNYALRADMTRDEFVKEVTRGLMPPPPYFPVNVRLNKEGYESVDVVLKHGKRPLSVTTFEATANETGAIILDTRSPEVFAKGYIPKSINIGIKGSFAPWVGALIADINQPILIVAEEGQTEEVVTRLARVGYDNALGYLEGGFKAWKTAGKEIDSVESVTADDVSVRTQGNILFNLMDVRKKSEYDAEHVIGALNVPLDYINEHLSEVDKHKTYFVHCAGGYRSMIFISILKARGYNRLINIAGGFKAFKESDKFELSPYVCPSTML